LSSEELILLLDQLQTSLPKCANQVLLRLVAKCIAGGTNQVDISAADLNRELRMGKDAVKVAKRALAGVVDTSGGNGTSTKWILPGEWFVVQRSLFAINSPVENWDNRPGNKDAPAWKPGRSPSQLPGSSGLETRTPALETRPLWTSYQAATSLETRPVVLENQADSTKTGLETRPPSIDRDRVLSSNEVRLDSRDSIEGVNRLPPEFRPDAEELKRWLRGFFAKHHPSHTAPDGPDEIILAKCLAIANLGDLVRVLQQLNRANTRPGDSWAWFVTVFCQRLRRIKNPAEVMARGGFHQPKKPASNEGGADFRSDLLREITAAVGKIH
jgi:hypothetical protein